jgi:hypothetical protein
LLTDESEKLAVAAVAALGTSAEGAVYVGKLLVAKKLPEPLRPAVIAVLKKHPQDKESSKVLAEITEGK